MPDLGLADLDAFAAVARARSFRGAAALSGVSASALSEALRRLEGRLGVRLLHRTTRSVTPTAAGARLLERLSPALREVSAALQDVAGEGTAAAGSLRLNVPSIVADLVLPPIVVPFLRAHPGVVLEVAADDSFMDVLAAGYDAGVRYDERLERDMIAVPVGPRVQRYVTAAAPAYLAAHGCPAHPRDVLGHACIRHRFRDGRVNHWEFERDGEVIVLNPSGPVLATATRLEVEAAVAGLGLIHSFEEFLAPALADGRLVEVLAAWSCRFSGPFLYYASRRHLPAPLRAFVDWIKQG